MAPGSGTVLQTFRINRKNENKTHVESVQLEKIFDFEIQSPLLPLKGLSVMFGVWEGVNSIVLDKPTHLISNSTSKNFRLNSNSKNSKKLLSKIFTRKLNS